MGNPHHHRDPEQHAYAIARAVDTAWNTANSSGRRDVALSVVAGLSLLTRRAPEGPDPCSFVRAQSPQEFTSTLREVYTMLINSRPELIHLLFPLMGWLFRDPDPAVQQAAKQVAETALGQGQLALTGTTDRYETDLLGMVLTVLKSHTASRANAQVYTPTSVAELLTRMNPPQEGQTVHDTAVGTGGLFRAAAQVMREHGRDPTTVIWCGADIDDLAIAACAINSLLWNLGPHMLLCVANTLTEPDWISRAQAHRAEIMQLADTVRRDKARLRAVERLVNPAWQDSAEAFSCRDDEPPASSP